MMEVDPPTFSSRNDCLVVGGGLAGLATALALRSHNYDVQVLEAQSESEFYDASQGAAVQLGANGFKALSMICGKETIETILQQGHILTNLGIILPNQTVVVIPDTSVADTGYPQLLIRWGVLRQILQETLPRSCIRTGVSVHGYQRQSDGSIVPLDSQGNPITISFDNIHKQETSPLLVAADGIDSPFYKDILGDSPCHNIVDNGRVNIKAVVNMSLDYGNLCDAVTGTPSISRGTALTFHAPDGSVACFAGSAGPNHTYWAISIVDSNPTDNETASSASECTHLRGEPLKEKVLQTLRALNAAPCQFIDLIQATAADTIFVQRSRQLDEIPEEFHYGDQMVLVGDAAHAMSPSYGQAANFGFEDAATLLYCLEHQLSWESYSQLRVPRCQTMHGKSSERIAKHTKGESTQDLFKWIGTWQPQPTTATTTIEKPTPSQTHSDEVMQVVA